MWIDPVVVVPCTYFIGMNGVPLEVVGGHKDVEAFLNHIQIANQVSSTCEVSLIRTPLIRNIHLSGPKPMYM